MVRLENNFPAVGTELNIKELNKPFPAENRPRQLDTRKPDRGRPFTQFSVGILDTEVDRSWLERNW